MLLARYVISTMRVQDSAVPHQKSVPCIMAGNCRLRDCRWCNKCISTSLRSTVFCGQLPKLHGNVEGVVYIAISIKVAVPVNHEPALRDLRHCDDGSFDGLATCTPTITHRTLRGATKKRYIVEDSPESTFLLSSFM